MKKNNYILLFLSYCNLIIGQNVESLNHFRFIGKKDGLLSENIKTTLRDDDGFLWLGSDKGLSRFDGKHFIHFVSLGKNQEKDILAPINSIDQDNNGNIWIAHKEGISRLNPKTFEFKYYNPIYNFSDNHKTTNCIQVFNTKQLGVIAGSYSGLWIYIPAVDTFQVLMNKQADSTSLPNDRIWFKTFSEDTIRGGIWGACSSEVWFLDKTTKTFYNNNNNPRKWAIFSLNHKATPTALCLDHTQKLWVSYRHTSELVCFNLINNSIDIQLLEQKITMHENNKHLLQIAEVKPHILWMSYASGGILVYNTLLKTIKSLPRREYTQTPSETEICAEIRKDNKEIWWLSTAIGLFQKEYEPAYLNRIECSYLKRPNDWTWLFFDEQNNLWIRSNKHKLFKLDKETKQLIPILTIGDPQKADNYLQLFKLNNKFWLNTNLGPVLFDALTEKLIPLEKRYSIFTEANKQNPFRLLGQLRDGRFISKRINGEGNTFTDKQLYYFNGETTHFSIFRLPVSLPTDVIRTVYQDSQGIIWFGLGDEKGVAFFDSNSGILRHYAPDGNRPNWLKGKTINRIFEDSKGGIWLSSAEIGIEYFNKKTESFNKIELSNGFSFTGVNPMIELPQGFLWYNSNSGLGLFNFSTSYNTSISMPESILKSGGLTNLTADKHGNIAFGVKNEIILFNPDSLLSIPLSNKPNISQITFFDKKYSQLEVQQGLKLPYNHNSLQFHISQIRTLDAIKDNYYYKLEGFDDYWRSVDISGTANYTNIPYGKYRFIVKIGNSDTTLPQNSDFVNLEILPAWYQTWWFRLLLFGAIAYAIYWFFQQRTEKLLVAQRAEMEKQQALERERTRIARDMHDDISSGLSAINLLANYVQNNPLSKNIETEIKHIAQSSTDINQRIKEIIWSVNSEADNLPSLVDFIKRYVSDFSDMHHIPCSVHVSQNIQEFKIMGDMRRNIFLCVKEAFNNAAKYAQASAIHLNIKIENNNLTITIKDNGVGFDSEKALTNGGNGLKNIRARMAQVNGEAQFLNKNGSTVVLKMKI